MRIPPQRLPNLLHILLHKPMQRSMALSTAFFNFFMLSGADGTLQPARYAFKPSSLALVDLRKLQHAILCLLHAVLFRADC